MYTKTPRISLWEGPVTSLGAITAVLWRYVCWDVKLYRLMHSCRRFEGHSGQIYSKVSSVRSERSSEGPHLSSAPPFLVNFTPPQRPDPKILPASTFNIAETRNVGETATAFIQGISFTPLIISFDPLIDIILVTLCKPDSLHCFFFNLKY